MFCIKNSAGLFFNGFQYIGGGKMKEQWSENQMVLFPIHDMAIDATEEMKDFFVEVLPVKVG